MSVKAASELERSSARKRPKGVASAVQQAVFSDVAASAPTPGREKWSAEKEVLLLQYFLRILDETGEKPSYEQIHESLQGSFPDDYSKDKVGSKLRNLKKKFLRARAHGAPRRGDPIYQLSERIWGGVAEGEVSAAVTPKAKPTPKGCAAETEVLATASSKAQSTPKGSPAEGGVPAAAASRAKPTHKGRLAEAQVPVAVTHKANPTPKRKMKKSPVVTTQQEKQDAVSEEEDRPRKSPRGHNSTPAPKPMPKGKYKKIPDVAYPEEATPEVEEDVGKPHKSSAPRPKKEKTKSKPHEFIATGCTSGKLQEGGNCHMLPGLTRILQQVYPEADEKVVLGTLESMNGQHMDEIRKKWLKLQTLKLEVAYLSADLAMDLTRAL